MLEFILPLLQPRWAGGGSGGGSGGRRNKTNVTEISIRIVSESWQLLASRHSIINFLLQVTVL